MRLVDTPGLLLAVLLFATPVTAWGQGADATDERTYGTSVLVSHTLHASAFTGSSSGVTYHTSVAHSRYCTGSNGCSFTASLLLPAGALITKFEFDACDQAALSYVEVHLTRLPVLEGAAVDLGFEGTSSVPQPGCVLVTKNITPAHTVNNVSNVYIVRVLLTGFATLDITTRFQTVRVFYKLQVSPAPAVATFNDVPTNHPMFAFIQALVAAGITSGCSASPPLFCPDNPVTRAQMAKFLGQALGLQFAP